MSAKRKEDRRVPEWDRPNIRPLSAEAPVLATELNRISKGIGNIDSALEDALGKSLDKDGSEASIEELRAVNKRLSKMLGSFKRGVEDIEGIDKIAKQAARDRDQGAVRS
jgi:hypothetical protein